MRFYRVLLRLFPRPFRRRFGDDMAAVFRDRLIAARRRGWHAVVTQYGAAIVDTARHGLAERRRWREDRRGGGVMRGLGQDLRYGWRFFVRRPAFAGLAIVALALGIGANTAIFSVVRSVLFAPLPYADAGRLAMIWHPAEIDGVTHLSLREVLSYRDEAAGFARVAAYTEAALDLTGDGEPERIRGAAVTADLFDTLGVPPAAGRGFSAADAEPGAPLVIAISHGLWQRRFGGDAGAIGRSIAVNGRPRTIVAVLPAAFRLPRDFQSDRPTDAWVPVTVDPANLGGWGSRSFVSLGRLRPDASPDTATASLRAVSRRWIDAAYVLDNGDGRFDRSAIPMEEFLSGRVRQPMLVLTGAVGFVLLIACANVVNLLLAKAATRRREVGVRLALGATPGRIVRQIFAESAVLAAAGGVAGVIVAEVGLRALIAVRPAFLPRVGEAAIDPLVLAFTAGLSIATAIGFGVVPAVHLARAGAGRPTTSRGVSSAAVGPWLRRALVVVQIAGAVVLVIGAGLLARTLAAYGRVDLGFDPRGILTAQLQVPASTYPQPADVVGFYRRIVERVEALPGVTAAGAIRLLPLTRAIGNWSITVEGAPRAPGDNPNGDFQWVTPGYFHAMRTPLVRGRLITDADREDALPVVLVNETMAARYWPGQDALGRRFKMGTADQPWMTIVGILGRTHHNGFAEPPRAEMYLPHAQLPQTVGGAPRAMAIVLRSSSDPASLAKPLREAVWAIDPNLPVADVRTLESIARDALSGTRFAALLFGLFATLALALAAVGVYGTISVLVGERAPEIGVRLTLGATPRAILRSVLAQGATMAGAGIAVGLAGAVALTRLLESEIYGVSALDPLTFAAVPVLLGLVALAASLRPAQRAAAIDPVRSIRGAE
jgi:predicted permease